MRKKERRAFIRITAYHLVKYKPSFEAKRETIPVLTTVKDVGADGICLRTQEYLPESSLIELKINFPSLDTPVFALAKVVWIKKRPKSSYYEVGTQFVKIEESLRKFINEHAKFVHRRLKKGFINLFKKGG